MSLEICCRSIEFRFGFPARDFQNQAECLDKWEDMQVKKIFDLRQAQKSWAGIGACIFCASFLCISSLAGGSSSNVWLDVVETSSEARISVTVPFSYGFAVIGSLDTGAVGAVSVEEGNLLLSNVRVKVNVPSAPGTEPSYSIETVSGAAVPIRNYSTEVRVEDADQDNPPRQGLPVSLEPYLEEVKNVTIAGQEVTHNWIPTKEEPTIDSADFKRYRMELDTYSFSIEGSEMDKNGSLADVLRLSGPINLDAPPDVPANGHTAAGTAIIPSEKQVEVKVKVGGIQSQYKQVEQSCKVGEIHWKVVPGKLPETP